MTDRIGLVSYSLWGLIRAVFDPFHKGTDLEGLLTRGGFVLSAITYASLVIPTYHLIRGSSDGSSATVEMVSAIMNMPLGRWLVGAVDLGGIAAGLYQMYIGVTMNFEQRFIPYALSPEQLRVAKQVGRFGTTARGVVFTLVSFFLSLEPTSSIPDMPADSMQRSIFWQGSLTAYGSWAVSPSA